MPIGRIGRWAFCFQMPRPGSDVLSSRVCSRLAGCESAGALPRRQRPAICSSHLAVEVVNKAHRSLTVWKKSTAIPPSSSFTLPHRRRLEPAPTCFLASASNNLIENTSLIGVCGAHNRTGVLVSYIVLTFSASRWHSDCASTVGRAAILANRVIARRRVNRLTHSSRSDDVGRSERPNCSVDRGRCCALDFEHQLGGGERFKSVHPLSGTHERRRYH